MHANSFSPMTTQHPFVRFCTSLLAALVLLSGIAVPLSTQAQASVGIEFVKTLLDISRIHPGPMGQAIVDTTYFGGKFIFTGNCTRQMAGFGVGGGLWYVAEDGSGTVVERQRCLDGGADGPNIYNHAINRGGPPLLDGDRGFVLGNSTWTSCVGGDCNESPIFGAGATKAVYYEISGDSIVPRTSSPEDLNYTASEHSYTAVAGGHMVSAFGAWIARLPEFTRLVTTNIGIRAIVGFRDYFLESQNSQTPAKVYKVENGALRDMGNVPGNPRFIISARDYSTSPERLVVYDPKTTTNPSARLLTYEATASGLQLVSERTAPTGFPMLLPNGFGVYGEYIVTSDTQGLALWNGTGKIATVSTPDGAQPFNIVISPSGYVAVSAIRNADATRTSAHL